jgi:hypothetical protein
MAESIVCTAGESPFDSVCLGFVLWALAGATVAQTSTQDVPGFVKGKTEQGFAYMTGGVGIGAREKMQRISSPLSQTLGKAAHHEKQQSGCSCGISNNVSAVGVLFHRYACPAAPTYADRQYASRMRPRSPRGRGSDGEVERQ